MLLRSRESAISRVFVSSWDSWWRNPDRLVLHYKRTRATNMHNYMKPLMQRIEKGQIDPSYIISHRITLDEAPEMYKVWRDKKQNVTKIVIDPWAA